MTEEHGPTSLSPTSPTERTLTLVDLTVIWFGAAISIAEIWAGGLPALTGCGLALGFLAVIFGRVIGNALMAATARIGADSGLPTMVLTRLAFGVRGSYLLAACNVLQLVGWTAWMLYVGYLYLDMLATHLGLPGGDAAPPMRYSWIILLGVLCTWWASGGHRLWKSIQRVSAALLLVLTIAMTAIVLHTYGLSGLWAGTAGSPLKLLGGADLVIAMSVSWVPLVADYSRYAVGGRAGATGTFWGYFVGGTWMYAVGLLVALAAGTSSPDQMVVSVMGSQAVAWAVVAMVLVLLSTVTTTFLDIYSTVVSAQNLFPALPGKLSNVVVGFLGILVALMLDVFKYQPFLEAIGAIFLPAFTVVLVDYFLLSRRRISVGELGAVGGAYWYTRGFNWRAIAAWVAGFAVYDWARGFASLNVLGGVFGLKLAAKAWTSGASIPCIVASAAVYLLLAYAFRTGKPAVARVTAGS